MNKKKKIVVFEEVGNFQKTIEMIKENEKIFWEPFWKSFGIPKKDKK